jgi:hypothetical protein
MFAPELKSPVASSRSRFGNHSATPFTAAGKLPAWPSPSANRAAPKPVNVRTRACSAVATLHAAIAHA